MLDAAKAQTLVSRSIRATRAAAGSAPHGDAIAELSARHEDLLARHEDLSARHEDLQKRSAEDMEEMQATVEDMQKQVSTLQQEGMLHFDKGQVAIHSKTVVSLFWDPSAKILLKLLGVAIQ